MLSRVRTAVLSALAVLLLAAGCAGSPTAVPAAASTAQGPTTTCSYPVGGARSKQVDPPPAQEPDSGRARVTLTLGTGTVALSLDQAKTPCTVGSFVHLARAGYFDGTTCHRLTASETLRVLQCGDPSGTGRGGPGYSFADETGPDMTYPAGTIAMANAGPDTNGSQFFLVYANSQLPPDYTVFGTVTAGMDVLIAIGARGTAADNMDGPPVQPVTITRASVEAG